MPSAHFLFENLYTILCNTTQYVFLTTKKFSYSKFYIQILEISTQHVSLSIFFVLHVPKTTRRHSGTCNAGRAHPCLDPFIHAQHLWLNTPKTLFTQPFRARGRKIPRHRPHANPTNKKQKLDTPLHTTSPFHAHNARPTAPRENQSPRA